MRYDNPPARLHTILTAGLAAEKGKPTRQVWAELLAVKVNDTDALLSGLGKVMTLPVETAGLVVKHFPGLASANEHWRSPIETAFFNQQLGGKWETFIQHINPYCVSQLATLAELLHTKLGSVLAESAAVTDLTKSIDELISQVEQSDLAGEIRIYLLQELMNLRFTLSEYALTGSIPAIRQAEAIVGHMHRDHSFFSFLSNHEVGKRVLDNLNAVVGVLTVVVTVSQIAAPTFALLPK